MRLICLFLQTIHSLTASCLNRYGEQHVLHFCEQFGIGLLATLSKLDLPSLAIGEQHVS